MALEKKEKLDTTKRVLSKLNLNFIPPEDESEALNKRTLSLQITDTINTKLFKDGELILPSTNLSDGATFGSLDYSEEEPEALNTKQ